MKLTWQGVCHFVRAESLEEEYLALVDLFNRPTPEERRRRLEHFRAAIDAARQRVPLFRLDILLSAGLTHSRRRLAELIEGGISEPDYPEVK